MVTGEPIPVEKSSTSKVTGGTVNGTGGFVMKAERVGSDTLLAQIVSLIAIPLGIICGMSAAAFEMINPFIQVFRPVSPLAWLPIVAIVVGATMADVAANSFWAKSYVVAAVVVTLCSLWATLINTANGVAQVEKDYLNVAKVLKLSKIKTLFKILIPSALPYMFTGFRLSLGIAWLVIVAAEMLVGGTGIGYFVWNEWNNLSITNVITAILVIGLVGMLLDQMLARVARLVTFPE